MSSYAWLLSATLVLGCAESLPSEVVFACDAGSACAPGYACQSCPLGTHLGGESVCVGGGASLDALCGEATPSVASLEVELESGSLPAVVSFAEAFAEGQVPAGMSVQARLAGRGRALLATQLDAKVRHPDGSLAHGVISVELPSDQAPLALELVPAAPAEGSPVLVDDTTLDGAGVTAEVVFTLDGTAYSANLRSHLDQPGDPWLEGPLVTERRWQIPVLDPAGEAHPNLTVWSALRATRAGAVRVETVVENTWAYPAEALDLEYDVGVTPCASGGGVSWKGLVHGVQRRWRHAAWCGGGAEVHVARDPGRYADLGLVSRYDETVPRDGLRDSVQAAWEAREAAPLEPGAEQDYQWRQGDLLQNPAILWLLSQRADDWRVMLGTAYRAGHYPVHFRTRDSGQPLSIDDFPGANLEGNLIDAKDPDTGADQSLSACHGSGSWCQRVGGRLENQPALAWVPYLATGERYLLETLQFWGSYNTLYPVPAARGFSEGVFLESFGRPQPYMLVAVARAAWASPEGDPLGATLADKLQNTLHAYLDRTATPGGKRWTPLGFPLLRYTLEADGHAPGWLADQLVWALGEIHRLGWDTRQTLTWLGGYTLGRMTDLCWLRAGLNWRIGDSDTGPWFDDWATVETETNDPVDCTGVAMLEPLSGNRGYSSVAQLGPALATLVDLGVEGAADAWARYDSRDPRSDYASDLRYAVRPRGDSER